MGMPRNVPVNFGVIDNGHPMARGLIGAWRLHHAGSAGAAGKLIDYSKYANTASIIGSGSISRTGTPYGPSSLWSGTVAYDLGTTATLKPSLPVTMGILFKPTSLASEMALCAFNGYVPGVDNNYGVHVRVGSGYVNLWYGDGGAGSYRAFTSSASLSTNTWYMLVGRVSGATDMQLLVNGIDYSGSYTGSGGALAYSSRSSYIGGYSSTPHGAMVGIISAVYYWRVGLKTEYMRMMCIDPYTLFRVRSAALSKVPIIYAAMAGDIGLANANDASLTTLALFAADVQSAIAVQSGLDVPLSVVSAIVNAAALSGSLLTSNMMAAAIVANLQVDGNARSWSFLQSTQTLGINAISAMLGGAPAPPLETHSSFKRFSARSGPAVKAATPRRDINEVNTGEIVVQDKPSYDDLLGHNLYIKKRA